MFTEIVYTPALGVIVMPLTVTASVSLLVAIVLVGFTSVISASEVAFFSLHPNDVAQLQNGNSKNEKNIARLLKSPQRLLATILISNTVLNIAVILLLTYFTESLFEFKLPLIGFLFQTVIITFILLLFGEIIPKIYAAQFSKRTALKTVTFLSFTERLVSPLVYLLVNSTSVVNEKLSKYNRSNISVTELSHALELTSTNQKEEDTELLEGIINFGSIEVVGIMTSRVDMVGIDIKSNFTRLIELVNSAGYSRMPVYAGTSDNIKGILYGKDLLPHIDKPAYFRWQSLIRPAYYVPETKKIDDLLSEFQKNKIHLAIVVDEYGGTSGLVTLEDIVEEILGDISDEYDEEVKMYHRLDQSTYVFEAKMPLNDFFKIDGINETDFTELVAEVETLAGMILEIHGDIPEEGVKISLKNYMFEVIAVDQRRIKKIKLTLKTNDEVGV